MSQLVPVARLSPSWNSGKRKNNEHRTEKKKVKLIKTTTQEFLDIKCNF